MGIKKLVLEHGDGNTEKVSYLLDQTVFRAAMRAAW